MLCVCVCDQNWFGRTWAHQLQGGPEVRLIFLASRVMCAVVRHKSSPPLVVFKSFKTVFPLLCVGFHLAQKQLCGLLHPPIPPSGLAHSLLTCPSSSSRIGCPALRPCAEEASAGSSMGAVLAGIPTTPSTTDLPPPPRCPLKTGAPPSPADGRRH